MRIFLNLCAFVLIGALNMSAQGKWKGFDMTRTTDAFANEVPVGTGCVIVEVYGSNKKFGQKPSEDGALKSSTVYIFDDKGYFTNDGEKTYSNTYNSDGLIDKRDIFRDGKLYERWIYKYVVDEKGPGVILEKYDSDGDMKGMVAWQGNNYRSIGSGGNLSAKLDKNGRYINGTVTISNSIEIHQKNTYNNHGFMESTLISAPFGSEEKEYTDYEYDNQGRWTQRYSSHELTKRRFLNREEYAQYLEERRAQEKAQAERERLKELENKTKVIKEEIRTAGHASTSKLYKLPDATVSLNEGEVYNSLEYVEFNIGGHNKGGNPMQYSYNKVIDVYVKSPAKYKFPDGSIEDVPSIFKGTLKSKSLLNKEYTKPIDVKIKQDKKTKEWYVANAEKIQKKYSLTQAEIDALNKTIAEAGKNHSFDTNKLYLYGITQKEISFISSPESSVKCNLKEACPIRFNLTDTKILSEEEEMKRRYRSEKVGEVVGGLFRGLLGR